MPEKERSSEILSPWWRPTVIIVIVLGFAILIWLAAKTYQDALPLLQANRNCMV